MRRLITRVVFVGLAAVIAAGFGTATALLTTTPGRALLARFVSEQSNRLVRGSVTIGRIDGDFRRHLQLDSVVVRDTSGVLLADIPRLELRFSLASFLARRVVFASVHAIGPRVQVIKHRAGRMNYQEVLRLGEGTGSGGRPPLVQFNDLRIVGGRLELVTPWNPDGRLRTEAQRDSALAAHRARPGRTIIDGPPEEGLQQVRVIDQLTAHFPILTVSSPDRTPLNGRIDTLAAVLSDPGVTVRDLRGTIVQGADSLLFDFEHAALPGTSASGSGRIDWPRDTILYDFQMAVPVVDLADLRWISPNFPAFTGQGSVVARSVAGRRAEFTLRDLTLGGDRSVVRGQLVAIVDVYRGLGFRDLDVDLTNLDLDVVRPFLDTLPLAGRLTGRLGANGFFDAMNVDFDWRFDDRGIEDEPSSWLALSGDLGLGGPDGFVFRGTRVVGADLDLRSVRLMAPAIRLDGRLVLAGTLEGPSRNVRFEGETVHSDVGRPSSQARGWARFDTRRSRLELDVDVTLDSLSFDGLRGSFPDTPMRGSLGGRARLRGPLDRLEVDASIEGQVGRITARGVVGVQSPNFEAHDLVLDFSNADLAALTPEGPGTRLDGRLELTGVVEADAAPSGVARLTLGAGYAREAPFDSARAVLAIEDSVLSVDTAGVWWEGGEASAAGTMGWYETRSGTLQGTAVALALGAFDSLALRVAGRTREEAAEGDLLAGRARAQFSLSGSLDQWRLEATGQADSVRWLDYKTRGVTGQVDWWGGRLDPTGFDARATVDSASIAGFVILGVDAGAETDGDRTRWRLGATLPNASRVRAVGSRRVEEGGSTIEVDSLDATVVGRRWRLARPVTAVAREAQTVLDSVRLETADGSGVIRLVGDFPGKETARLEVSAFGIGVRELYALAQRDTTGVGGSVSLDGRIEGTRRRPRLRGSGSVTGAVLGEFRAPLVRGVFNYADRRLQSNLTFWRTGSPVLNVDAALPLDLGIGDVTQRQLPGTLTIRGQADSVDLAVVEAFTRNLRSVGGTAAVDVKIEGTWEDPRLGGSIAFRDGSARVPGLRVGYRNLNGRVRLSGDSLTADGLRVEDEDGLGYLTIGGGIQLDRLTHPVLDLAITSENFRLINARDYLTLEAAASVNLRGPIERPILTGSATATNSVLFFSDLITKDIVNLEDPMNADLVDTTLLRAQNLRAQFQSRFLDSLQISDLRFRAGEGVWLRSGEANLQLEGRVTINKARWTTRGREYRVSGELQAPRGTYTLKLGPVYRTFLVDRGTLRYFNTPDLDAQLDIEARRVVRTVGGEREEYPIIAKITGTLLAPKLALTLPADRAPVSERDLVAMLITGAPANSILNRQVGFQVDELLSSLGSTVLSAELQRTLISDVGLDVDLVEIRPGLAQGNSLFGGGGNVTTLAFGQQLASRLFAIFSAGACIQTGDFSYRYLGASLEYRLHPTLKFQLSAEPVQSCLSQVAQTFGARNLYQFATDLRWDREY